LLDPSSRVTISGPVQLPSVMLSAGTYQFLGEKAGLVRIYNSKNQLIATLSASPATRAAKGEVLVLRQRAGLPPEAAAWYPAGGTVGFEFRYQPSAKSDATKAAGLKRNPASE
jgi:hypothetical protein